jgi:hypothetical protein
MSSLITRFKNELLDAEIDLNSSSIIQEHDGGISVTAQLSRVRVFFAAVFALPCLYFLIHLIGNPDMVNLTVALVFCPALVLMALLIGGTIAGKSIDPYRRQATKSLRLFSWSTEVSEPLAAEGVITLTWKWCKSGDQSTGYYKYIITVRPETGLVFITTDDYPTARAFAARLATLLSFPLQDSVPQPDQA